MELNLQLALAAGCHRPYRSGESRRDQLYSGLTSRTSTYDEISEPRIASRVNVWGGVYTEGHVSRRSQASEYRIQKYSNTSTPGDRSASNHSAPWPTVGSSDPDVCRPAAFTRDGQFRIRFAASCMCTSSKSYDLHAIECIVSTKPEPHYDATATTRPYASRGVPLDSSESQTPQPDIRIRL